MEGGCGLSGGSGPRSPDGLHPFSLGGKTPFQSCLGMAQQHSSHNGVSQGWGVGGKWVLKPSLHSSTCPQSSIFQRKQFLNIFP